MFCFENGNDINEMGLQKLHHSVSNTFVGKMMLERNTGTKEADGGTTRGG